MTARGGEERAVCYLNKLTGAMQVGGRPQDFRPTLRVRLSFFIASKTIGAISDFTKAHNNAL